MSVEAITTIIGVVTILLALASGFGWMIHRMDARIDGLRHELGARIDGLRHELGARIDGTSQHIDGTNQRIDRVKDELVEVKIALARVEGPPRRFIAAP